MKYNFFRNYSGRDKLNNIFRMLPQIIPSLCLFMSSLSLGLQIMNFIIARMNKISQKPFCTERNLRESLLANESNNLNLRNLRQHL